MSYPTKLDVQVNKINCAKFGKYGLVCLTENEFAKSLNKMILDEIVKSHNMNVKKLRKLINEVGHKFKADAIESIPSATDKTSLDLNQLYTQFVGDWFEAFAEFFLKTFDNDERFGVKNYTPAVLEEDLGVDGYGICYDDTKGAHKCVVQVKYRLNSQDEIDYSCLARTFTSGVLQFNVNPEVDNCVILFCSCKGANLNTQKVLGKRLYVIDDTMINREINNVSFWQSFCDCF